MLDWVRRIIAVIRPLLPADFVGQMSQSSMN
jgi:hypothetical protein